MLIHVLTRCTRPNNLLEVKNSIWTNKPPEIDIKWHILFDTSAIKDIDADLLSTIQFSSIIKFLQGKSGDYGHDLINRELDIIDSGWIYILDDDNTIHKNFYSEILEIIKLNPTKLGFIFSQQVDGKDFSKLDIREAKGENIEVGKIDMSQFLLHTDLISNYRLRLNEYRADGYFIKEIYDNNPDSFLIFDKILCSYNSLQKEKMPISLPKVLLIGENVPNLKSRKILDYEEDKMSQKFISDDKDINKTIGQFDPDTIITIGGDFNNFPGMSNKSLDIRSRWIHFPNYDPNIGEIAYQCSMSYILGEPDKMTPLVSFFTPFFNTGNKLIRTYQSLKDQTYNNWEWVLVNDSTDEGKTLKIAEKLAEMDPRIKIYDFRSKSGGVIGESKYRAAALCRGKYIMELDHDDILTNDATFLMVQGFQNHPECKFVYSDCSEIDELHNSLTYGEGFCFGYGSYHKEIYNGKEYMVSNSVNINPKTIRHIVGVPNHFRAWDREFYHSIGGHNRRLTIADDYELIVRSFLKTKFLRIPKLCYLQFFHNSGTLNNTQDSSRADIQRRVRTIAQYYNFKIRDRFEELGVEDWAFNQYPEYPLLAESRFGIEENSVNLTYKIEVSLDKIEYLI